jgi:hypothetical protein
MLSVTQRGRRERKRKRERLPMSPTNHAKRTATIARATVSTG